jgi:hypothetical protein
MAAASGKTFAPMENIVSSGEIFLAASLVLGRFKAARNAVIEVLETTKVPSVGPRQSVEFGTRITELG